MGGKLAVALVKGVARLPFPILYGCSNILYTILFRLIGYRKAVVFTNLRNAFPEKSEKEIHGLAHRFFRYLCDLILEGLKCRYITPNQVRERLKITNIEELTNWYNQGRSVILVLGHHGNWEYAALSYSLEKIRHQINIVYHPLSNGDFDDLMNDTRSRFGAQLIPMRDTYRVTAEEQREGKVTNLVLVGDQTPSAKNGYWMEFLNQDTPVFLGCERIARKYDMPLVYVHVNRVKRGFYEATLETIHANPANTKPGEITELHTKVLEQDILKQPETWVWSHKRWKHKRPHDLPAEQISTRYPFPPVTGG